MSRFLDAYLSAAEGLSFSRGEVIILLDTCTSIGAVN